MLSLLAPILELDFGNIFVEVPGINTVQIGFSELELHKTVSGNSTEILEREVDFSWIFYLVYLVISSLFLVRFGRNFHSIVKRIKDSKSFKLNGVTMVPLPEACTPYSFFHFVFVNQNELEENRMSEVIFDHEQTHVRQCHSIEVVFAEALICFFWLNPFIWIYKRLIVENHEFLADAQVIKNGVNMDSYAHLLVQYKNHIFKSPLMSGFIFSQTKNRINMLYKQRKSNFGIPLFEGNC